MVVLFSPRPSRHRPVLDDHCFEPDPPVQCTRCAFLGQRFQNTVCEYFIIFYRLIITPILPRRLSGRAKRAARGLSITHNAKRLHSDGRSIKQHRLKSTLILMRNHVQHFYCILLFTRHSNCPGGHSPLAWRRIVWNFWFSPGHTSAESWWIIDIKKKKFTVNDLYGGAI